MKESKIPEEIKLAMITFIIICINAIIIVIMSLWVKNKYIENGIIQTLIIGIEAISIGIVILITTNKIRKKEHTKCLEKCKGVMIDNKLKMNESKTGWSRYPTIEYKINEKTYQISSTVGYGGILSLFLKQKKKTVYYNKENPKEAYVKNYVPEIISTIFIIAGVLAIFIVLLLLLKI